MRLGVRDSRLPKVTCLSSCPAHSQQLRYLSTNWGNTPRLLSPYEVSSAALEPLLTPAGVSILMNVEAHPLPILVAKNWRTEYAFGLRVQEWVSREGQKSLTL